MLLELKIIARNTQLLLLGKMDYNIAIKVQQEYEYKLVFYFYYHLILKKISKDFMASGHTR